MHTLLVLGTFLGLANFATAAGSFDGISTSVQQGQNVTASGWAVDPATGPAPAGDVVIEIDKGFIDYIGTGGLRADVQAANLSAHWSNLDCTYSGWTYSINANGFTIGTHTMTVSVMNYQDGFFQTLGSKSFTVTPSTTNVNVLSVSYPTATGTMVVSNSHITLGNSITFSMSESNANAGWVLASPNEGGAGLPSDSWGGGIIWNPPNSYTVTPTAPGTYTYKFYAYGGSLLNWTFPGGFNKGYLFGPTNYGWQYNGVDVDTLPSRTSYGVSSPTTETWYLKFVSNSGQIVYSNPVVLDTNNSTTPAVSLSVTVTVDPAPVSPTITQPANLTVPPGSNATFSVTATGYPSSFTYQWQRLPAGSSSWSNLSDNGTYSGSITSILTVNNATLAMNGAQFLCIVSNSAGQTYSNPATLKVVTGAPPPNSTVPLPPWAVAALIVVVFWVVKATLPQKHRA